MKQSIEQKTPTLLLRKALLVFRSNSVGIQNINTFMTHSSHNKLVSFDSAKIGYEISFNKYFYEHVPLRSIEEVTADILALEKRSDGLLA